MIKYVHGKKGKGVIARKRHDNDALALKLNKPVQNISAKLRRDIFLIKKNRKDIA